MTDKLLQESPLSQFISENCASVPVNKAGVLLTELPFLEYVNLRGDPTDQMFLDTVEGIMGMRLPLRPNTGSIAGEVSALWLGPNEWLIVTPPNQKTSLAQSLGDSLQQIFTSVTEITGGQTLLNLSGPCALKLISKGCSLDLHPHVFVSGRCAQTMLAKAPAVIWRPDGTPSYNIIVRRTYADYLARWLEDAAYEYGLALLPDSSN